MNEYNETCRLSVQNLLGTLWHVRDQRLKIIFLKHWNTIPLQLLKSLMLRNVKKQVMILLNILILALRNLFMTQ